MTIIKVLNNTISFEHPIVLNSDKQYRLGVSHLMFELDQTFSIHNFMFDYYVPTSQDNEDTVTCIMFGNFTIKTLQKEIQSKINCWFNVLTKQYEKEPETFKKLKAMSTTFKLQVEKESDKKYVMHIIFPFKTEITKDGNFCKIFHFEDYIGAVLKPGETYISKNIINFFRPFSVIQWHCNVAEYSYANHDDHPHIHKQEELLHISFVSNNF